MSLYFWKDSKINASGKSPNDCNEKGNYKSVHILLEDELLVELLFMNSILKKYFFLMCLNCKNVLEGFIGVMEISLILVNLV